MIQVWVVLEQYSTAPTLRSQDLQPRDVSRLDHGGGLKGRWVGDSERSLVRGVISSSMLKMLDGCRWAHSVDFPILVELHDGFNIDVLFFGLIVMVFRIQVATELLNALLNIKDEWA